MTKKRTQHTVDEREAAGELEDQRQKINKKDEQVPRNLDDAVDDGGRSEKRNADDEEEGRGGVMKGKDKPA